MFMATWLCPAAGYSRSYCHTTFVAELARKGCRKLNWSALPAIGQELDIRVQPRDVPLAIRRAAKLYLLTN